MRTHGNQFDHLFEQTVRTGIFLVHLFGDQRRAISSESEESIVNLLAIAQILPAELCETLGGPETPPRRVEGSGAFGVAGIDGHDEVIAAHLLMLS